MGKITEDEKGVGVGGRGHIHWANYLRKLLTKTAALLPED